MASTFTPPLPAATGLRAALGRFARLLVENSRGWACAREAERLSALTDAELARLGVRRDGIIQHAFARFLV